MHVNKMCVNYPLVYLKRNIFNIKHLNKSLHKTFILAYIRITELLKKKKKKKKKKNISRSLLKNLILQNLLHRLNIWEYGYYRTTD